MRRAWRELKYETKRKGKVMRLTLKQFTILVSLDCAYCGSRPRYHRHFKDLKLNGLDRLDNKRGYILDNVVPCCTICNGMKSSRTPQEFLRQVQRIHKWLRKANRDLLRKLGSSKRKSNKATC